MVSESQDPEIQALVMVLEQVFPNGTLNAIPLPPWVARPKNPYVRLAVAMHRLGVRKLSHELLRVRELEVKE